VRARGNARQRELRKDPAYRAWYSQRISEGQGGRFSQLQRLRKCVLGALEPHDMLGQLRAHLQGADWCCNTEEARTERNSKNIVRSAGSNKNGLPGKAHP
jgi:predicted Abi (CAAX) family protease